MKPDNNQTRIKLRKITNNNAMSVLNQKQKNGLNQIQSKQQNLFKFQHKKIIINKNITGTSTNSECH